jgi:hypothetical protein
MRYEYAEESYYSEMLEVETLEQALEQARDLLGNGDWGQHDEDFAGCCAGASVNVLDDAGEQVDTHYIEIEIMPDEPTCEAAPDHDWQPDSGGCRENPGVWSTGGTSMRYIDHCSHCGMRRTRDDTGSQRNPGESDTVRYEERPSITYC